MAKTKENHAFFRILGEYTEGVIFSFITHIS